MNSKVLDRYKPLNRCLLLIGMFIAVAVALVAGPSLQLLFSALLGGEGGSVYESVHGQAIAPFPLWSIWLAQSLWPGYLITAGAIVLVANHTRQIRSTLVGTTVVTAVLLTAFDIAEGQTAGTLVISIICNAIGGTILGVYVLALVALTTRLQVAVGSNRAAYPLWLFYPALIGLILAFILYFSLKTLLHPEKGSITIVATPPYNGYYLHEAGVCALKDHAPSTCTEPRDSAFDAFYEKRDLQNEIAAVREAKQFNFFYSVSAPEANELSWIGASENLKLNWTRRKDEPMTLTLSIAQGCLKPENVKSILPEAQVIAVATSDLSLSLTKGLFQLRSVEGDSISLAALEEDDVKEFNVRLSDSGAATFDVSRFLSESIVQLDLSSSRQLFDIIAMPRTTSEGRRKMATLKLQISADGQQRNLEFYPSATITPERKIVCSKDFSSRGEGAFDLDGFNVNLILEARAPKTIKVESMSTVDNLVVNGMNGWVSVRDKPANQIDDFVQSGDLQFISVNSAGSTISVNGVDRRFDRRTSITAYGPLYGAITNGNLAISGIADAAYADGIRLNRTRWEKLDGAMKIAILAGVPALLLYFRNFLLALISRRWIGWFLRAQT